MNPQWKKGVLDVVVLAQLAKKDQYGYELCEHIQTQMDVTTASLYVLLKRFVNDGLVTTYLVDGGGGPARKYYSLTVEGKKRCAEIMKQWLQFVSGVNALLK